MNSSPEGWGRRALTALALIVVISYGARLAYSLLAPLVPVAFSLIGVGLVALFFFQRRR
jgi:CHASE2 domain-containing sensor protein